MTLISTPLNSLELCPFAGFDITDFLWRSENSETFQMLKEEFQTKIKEALLDENISVEITRGTTNSTYATVYINIYYTDPDDRRSARVLPLRLTEGVNKESTLYAYGNKILNFNA